MASNPTRDRARRLADQVGVFDMKDGVDILESALLLAEARGICNAVVYLRDYPDDERGLLTQAESMGAKIVRGPGKSIDVPEPLARRTGAKK